MHTHERVFIYNEQKKDIYGAVFFLWLCLFIGYCNYGVRETVRVAHKRGFY